MIASLDLATAKADAVAILLNTSLDFEVGKCGSRCIYIKLVKVENEESRQQMRK